MDRQVREGQPLKKSAGRAKRGLHLDRYFTTPGVDPADEVAWEREGRTNRLSIALPR